MRRRLKKREKTIARITEYKKDAILMRSDKKNTKTIINIFKTMLYKSSE